MNNRTISLCIPTYNRFDLLINSFVNVLGDDRIDEIIISDDCSNIEIYEKLKSFVNGITKIKLYRNEQNQDCYKNKRTAIGYAKNDWGILLDSDNEITSDYVDKIFNVVNWDDYVAMLPAYASPHFDYSQYSGRVITKQNVHLDANNPTFTCALNTANYFVNKEAYMNAFDNSIDPHTADSIYMNYRLLNNDGKLYVVPGLQYLHRVDDHKDEEKGHYNINLHKTPIGFHDGIIEKLKNMR